MNFRMLLVVSLFVCQQTVTVVDGINQPDANCYTPLVNAVYDRDTQRIEQLLADGALIFQRLHLRFQGVIRQTTAYDEACALEMIPQPGVFLPDLTVKVIFDDWLAQNPEDRMDIEEEDDDDMDIDG